MRLECSGGIDLLERLIDQSIMRRLDPFVALLVMLLFISRIVAASERPSRNPENRQGEDQQWPRE